MEIPYIDVGVVFYGCDCRECVESGAIGHFHRTPAATPGCILRMMLRLTVRFGDRPVDWDRAGPAKRRPAR